MGKHRRSFTPGACAKVALAALRGEKTVNQIAREFEVHPVQVTPRKKQALDGLPASLADRRGEGARPEQAQDQSALIDELYRQIGQLKVELDWLKRIQMSSATGAGRSPSRHYCSRSSVAAAIRAPSSLAVTPICACPTARPKFSIMATEAPPKEPPAAAKQMARRTRKVNLSPF